MPCGASQLVVRTLGCACTSTLHSLHGPGNLETMPPLKVLVSIHHQTPMLRIQAERASQAELWGEHLDPMPGDHLTPSHESTVCPCGTRQCVG